MIVDLSICRPGDVLTARNGKQLMYLQFDKVADPLYPHVLRYPVHCELGSSTVLTNRWPRNGQYVLGVESEWDIMEIAQHTHDASPTSEHSITHADMVRTLSKSGEAIRKELSAEDCHLLHMAMGVAGEAGELIDAVKKALIYRKSLDIENVIEELGDLEYYMEGLRQGLKIDREACLRANISKLGKRYPGFKYSNQAAQARADKQEDPNGKS